MMPAIERIEDELEGLRGKISDEARFPILRTTVQTMPKMVPREVVGQRRNGAPKVEWVEFNRLPKGIEVAWPAWLTVIAPFLAGGTVAAIAGLGRRTAFPAPGVMGMSPSQAAMDRGGFKTPLEEALEELFLGTE